MITAPHPPDPELGQDRPADRLHNREDPSASEMAEMLREVQDSLAALDGRLDGLEGAQGDSSLVTRRLAANVAEMGEALAKRVRSLEGGGRPPELAAPIPAPAAAAPPPSPGRGREGAMAISMGMAAVLALVLAGFWLFGRPGGAPAAKPKPHAPPPAAAIVPAPAVTASPAVPKAAAPRPTFAPRHRPLRRPDTRAAPSPQPGPPTAGFRSFGPAAAPSTAVSTAPAAAPAVASAANPPKPPK